MSTGVNHTPKDALKDAASRYGCNLKDLLVLAPGNDPFNCGSPTDIKQAEWFADLWSRFGFQKGMHLRRIHYVLISRPFKRHDGKPYLNTDKDWQYLQDCSRRARYLQFVAADDFVDHRNPAPKI